MATRVKSSRDDFIGVGWRLLRDCYRFVGDFLSWGWGMLWRFNRGVIRSLMPGQHRSVHGLVTVCAVLLELVGLAVLLVSYVQSH